MELAEPKYGSTRTTDHVEIAEKILDDLETFVIRHSLNLRPYVSRELIEYHFQVERLRSRKAKELVVGNVSDEDFEEAAG